MCGRRLTLKMRSSCCRPPSHNPQCASTPCSASRTPTTRFDSAILPIKSHYRSFCVVFHELLTHFTVQVLLLYLLQLVQALKYERLDECALEASEMANSMLPKEQQLSPQQEQSSPPQASASLEQEAALPR